MANAFKNPDGKWNWKVIGYHARSTFAVLLSLTVLLGGSYFVYYKAHKAYIAWRTQEDYIGDGKKDIIIEIPKGASVLSIGELLTEEGVIRSPGPFLSAAARISSGKINAGRYRLKTELPAKKAAEMLSSTNYLERTMLTFPEGMTVKQQWAEIKKLHDKGSTTITKKDLVAVAKDAPKMGLPNYAKGSLEGFLFPQTYEITSETTASSLLQKQLDQFNNVASKINLDSRAQLVQMTPLQVVTIASLIEGEVSKEKYKPLVAAVIYNRLQKGMKLELDSTVHYIVGKTGHVATTDDERAIKSPYNTYLNTGLPPGPINNPGESSLVSALSPNDNRDVLYFVTVDLDSGETKFSKTLDEHHKNVEQFKKWCQKHKGRC